MTIPNTQIRKPKIIYKLQVHYKDIDRDEVVYFSSKPTTLDLNGSGNAFRIENENEIFVCAGDDVFSFSITEEQEKEC